MPLMPAAGLAATPSAAPSAATTTTHPGIRTASRSWPAGTGVAQLNWEHNSWTAPLDARRIHPCDDTGKITAEQVKDLVGRLGNEGSVPLFVFDAGYDPIGLSVDLADVRAQILVRVRSDRVFYATPPEPAAGQVGRRRRHRQRHSCAEPANWPTPDDTLTATDSRYGRVEVAAWSGLHPKLARRGRWAGQDRPPIVTGTVIRVQVEHLPKPTGNGRTLKTLWL
jgi:hypothetical protein